MARIWGAATVALLALANCGGGGGTTTAGTTPTTTAAVTAASDPAGYFDTVVGPGYNSYFDTLYGNPYDNAVAIPNTAFKGMPSSGSATYTGYALVGVNRDNPVPGAARLTLTGTASVTADFAAGTVAGSATNFVGGPTGNLDTTTGKYPGTAPITYFPGTVALSGGCIGTANGCAATRPNQLSTAYSGTLSNGTNSVSVSGTALGDFKGTPIQGVAITGTSSTDTVDGTTVPGVFAIFAKP